MKKSVDYYLNLDYEIVVKKVTKEEGDGWFAYYKDFKGVMGDGENAGDAINNAIEAFKAYINSAIKNKEQITEPSKDRAVRINISVNESLLKKIDEFIAPSRISRSAFLQKLALKEIGA
ncbi:MAG: type II toxin-antitoxin system HicB family antitoxin [Campylobacteraceae bacterium]|jgi:predicted RNase H-like HicB family nuclease|nr:type II toxin-antitoxin system HicB family antitoxin [Campylobacteraceae bacterium]